MTLEFAHVKRVVETFQAKTDTLSTSHRNVGDYVEKLVDELKQVHTKFDDTEKELAFQQAQISSNNEKRKSSYNAMALDLENLNKTINLKIDVINETLSQATTTKNVPATQNSNVPLPDQPISQLPSTLAPQSSTGSGINALAPIDLTTILEQTSQVKPVFPPFKPEVMTVTKWQYLCMLKLTACKNPYYHSFVLPDSNNGNTLNPNLPKEKKAALFSLIHDALPNNKLNLEFITKTMIRNADGLSLWTTCGVRFAPKKKGHYEKEELKNEFKTLSKNDNETNSSFLRRIEQKANELTLHGINLQAHEKALTLLKGLTSEYLRTPIVAIMQDDGNGEYKEWIVEDDLMHTLNKAESRIKYEKAAASLLTPKRVPNPYKAAVLTSRASGSSSSTTRPTTTATSLLPKQQLIQELKACPDQQKRINKLFQWKAKEKDGCILHPNLKLHKFLRCDDVGELCKANGWTEDLVETKLRNQMFAEKKLQEESSSTTTSKATIKAIDKQVAARKAALEAQQAQTPLADTHEVEDSDNCSQDTRSTIATDK